mmetsp:Transcript_24778/g.65303  ORF Transcript_24778/g.65303 Transcript_24778/m.65303 type:complete len:132 (-) Transcript_24778:7-402(-)
MVRGTIHDPIGGQSADTIAAKQRRPIEEFEQRRQAEFEERRRERNAEGGRGGGHNDRQVVERREARPEDEGGIDEFGRKVGGRAGGLPSKAERAAAALERLRQKSKGTADEGIGARGSARARSRSRSGPRR